ncbi:MAG: leucine-rich repeat domain-containing protein [Synergistaceae bacterium]|nr:leucine-rich repeat domain-containing protein [Synergistaceae bacterium]
MKNDDFEIKDGVLVRYLGDGYAAELPPGLDAVGEGAFRDCRSLHEVYIPDGVTEIRKEAFQWCVNLRRVTAPESVSLIGRDAFAGTTYYKYYSENETDWREDFLFIGRCLVKARRNLRRAEIPEGTVMIAADAFAERVLLGELSIPQSVSLIDWRAFADCTGLSRAHIPAGVRTIGWHCFKGCSRLCEVSFEEGTKDIENVIFAG